MGYEDLEEYKNCLQMDKTAFNSLLSEVKNSKSDSMRKAYSQKHVWVQALDFRLLETSVQINLAMNYAHSSQHA